MGEDSKKKIELEIEDAALASAIWILSCNDPIPTMTYTYISGRLATNIERVKKLLEDHKELFSTSISDVWLNDWRNKMFDGQYLPSRIADLTDHENKTKEILNIVKEDLFRSQFRLTCIAEISPIEITKWGLDYIEKARKAKNEVTEEKQKKLKEFWIPTTTLLIALVTVLLTSYWQYRNIQAQKEIKEYEVSFKPKQDSYTLFVSSASMAFDSAYYGDKNSLRKLSNTMEANLFIFESLIKNENKNLEIWDDYNKFNRFLNNLSNKKSGEMTEEQFNQVVAEYRKLFGKLKDEIYQELFSEKS